MNNYHYLSEQLPHSELSTTIILVNSDYILINNYHYLIEQLPHSELTAIIILVNTYHILNEQLPLS